MDNENDVSTGNTESLESDIAKMGLFVMKLDQVLMTMPPIEINSQARNRIADLRLMMDGHKKALKAELHQVNTPDS